MIVTGVSTAEEFLGAINDKGASLTNESTASSLLEAINATGGNVSFQSPNEVVVEAVNTEVPSEFVPWKELDATDTLKIKGTISIPHDIEPYITIYRKLFDTSLDAIGVASVDGQNSRGVIDFTTEAESNINVVVHFGKNAGDDQYSLVINYVSDGAYTNDTYSFVDGSFTDSDGVTHELSDGSIVKLPELVYYHATGSVGELGDLFEPFIDAIVAE